MSRLLAVPGRPPVELALRRLPLPPLEPTPLQVLSSLISNNEGLRLEQWIGTMGDTHPLDINTSDCLNFAVSSWYIYVFGRP